MTTLDLLSTPTPRTSGRVERFGTIVVGGGQAGLSVGYHLQQRDLDFVIVDRTLDVAVNSLATLASAGLAMIVTGSCVVRVASATSAPISKPLR